MGKTIRYTGSNRKREQAEMEREEQTLNDLLRQDERRTRRKGRTGERTRLRNITRNMNDG